MLTRSMYAMTEMMNSGRTTWRYAFRVGSCNSLVGQSEGDNRRSHGHRDVLLVVELVRHWRRLPALVCRERPQGLAVGGVRRHERPIVCAVEQNSRGRAQHAAP